MHSLAEHIFALLWLNLVSSEDNSFLIYLSGRWTRILIIFLWQRKHLGLVSNRVCVP